jgi:DNA integrity scanning protein DisA with diadenylate cyclase activity
MTADDARTTGLGFRAKLMSVADQAYLAARSGGGSQMDGTTAVVDAVEPIIRADAEDFFASVAVPNIVAEVRERIAQEIEAEVLNVSGRSEQATAYADGLEHAARIARGGAQ